MTLLDCLESGMDFIAYLGETTAKPKKELKDIYNSKFKPREGVKDQNFSSVLYALVKFGKVHIRQGYVFIRVKPQVRMYCDQWRRPRAPQPPHSPGPGHNNTAEAPAAAGGPSTPQNAALMSKKKLLKIIEELKVNRKDLTAGKEGIEITSSPASGEGKVTFTVDRLKETFLVKFTIQNTGPNFINFTFYTALHKFHCFTLEDERKVSRACPVFLCPKESYEVVVRYNLSHYGYFPAILYFEFSPEDSAPFCIVREIEACALTPLAKELGPVAPYRAFQMVIYKPVETVIVEGVPPESFNTRNRKIEVKLKEYNYPSYLKDLAKQRIEDTQYLSKTAREQLPSVQSLLNSSLKMKTYSQQFHLLLHLEELQSEVDIRKYDLGNQTMTRDPANRHLLILRVPGVAENRPSVLQGDVIMVSNVEDTVPPITKYRGYVHRVELDRVKLGFHKKFLQSFESSMKFNVEFTTSRLTLRLQHRAVDLATKYGLKKVLFPSGAAAANLPMPTIRLCNKQLENNPQQKSAVRHIVAGTSKPAPYLVFGPPGTGKTITLVEAMNQISMAEPSAHILACAPSNSACDLLCERLMVHMNKNEVYRLYAISRDPRTVPRNLLEHCNLNQAEGAFVYPDKYFLMKYKVIVTTLYTAGRLVSEGVPVGHFTHIFLDEAGQAAESECVIAVAGLLNAEEGQLVLAGDPKQLGPIIRSRFALQHGLALSLLERLMTQNDLYKEKKDTGRFDSRFVTKLLQNYRSHDAILKIPNEKFYNNELQVFANRSEREAYCSWSGLPTKGFPVIYCGVMGKDQREANSPSFFNVTEIDEVMRYLRLLVNTQGQRGIPRLSAKDIGIIAPYRKQVEKIRKALNSDSSLSQLNDVTELKVGCVEEFQGQERKIIIISTVRSSNNYVKLDKDFNIGFLSNDKRFNVAITRAKSLLIVVGNPVIFNKDPNWKDFISYCERQGGYDGYDYKDDEGEEEVVKKIMTLKICVDPENPASDESSLQL